MSLSGSEQAVLTVYTALLNNGAVVQQQEVAADQSISFTVSSGNTSVGAITSSPLTITGAMPSAVTTFQPVGTGTSVITASSTAGFQPSGVAAQAAMITATVNSCTLSISNDLTVGQYLEAQGSVFLSCPAGSGGTTVTLTSNSSFVKLAVNPTDPGSNQIVLTIPANQFSASYWVYGLGTGLTTGEGASPLTATYGAAATGYGSATDTVTLAPSGVIIEGQGETATGVISVSASTGGPRTLTIYTYYLSTDGNYTPQQKGNEALAGNVPLSVMIANSNSGAGTLSSSSVSIAGGSSSGTVTFTPLSTGTTTISETQPAGWAGTVGTYGGTNLTQVGITVTH
jgi:hypothetical protein